ncbi:MAG: hypothetical protein IKV03_00315 [Alphaproteobacteria bacterium]|nr:hypothetical protein [Alphaproteobacteria bacterium]
MFFFNRNQNYKSNLFKKQKAIENGRSMVEIIAVLTIIGVLSIGGITGYSYGMIKYHSNVTLQDINLRMIDIMAQAYQNKSEISIPAEWDLRGRSGYVIDVFQNLDSEPSIMVEQVPSDVCKMVLKNSPDTQDIFVGTKVGEKQVDGDWYLGDNENICGTGEKKEMLFSLSPEILAAFNPDDETMNDPEEPVVECYSNVDCNTEKPYCDNGSCVQCSKDAHCSKDKPYCSSSKICTACYKQPNGTPCVLAGRDYEGMCYGDANFACLDWCGETPLVGSCYVMDKYCINQGGRASVYQLMLISENPLYCQKQREAGKAVTATYGSKTYTYTDNCPTTERYKGLWNKLRNGCSNRTGRYISNINGVEVNKTGSLTGSECGSGNWWSSGVCADDVQAIIDAYDAENPE